MRARLTKNQKLVYLSVRVLFQKLGKSPTLAEIKRHLKKKGLKVKSLNSIAQYLDVLEKKGYIRRKSGIRGIIPLKDSDHGNVDIPLFGLASCGEALAFADDRIDDTISVSKKYINGKKEEYFFVRASGDSMDKLGINDNDLVLVKKTEEPPENKCVVAVINGLGTIKKFKKINGAPILLPNSTNKKHKPIILHPDDIVSIVGKVVEVFNFSEISKI